MTEGQKTAVTGQEKQVKELFAKELQGHGRPRKELKALIPPELAKQRHAIGGNTFENSDHRIEVGRELLTTAVLKALIDEGLCKMKGAEGKEKVCWVLPAAVKATVAAPPTSTKSNKSDRNASQATMQRNTQNGGKTIDVLTGNNESATPNDTTYADRAVVVNVPVETINANPITKQVDDKTSNSGVVEMQFHPVAEIFPLMTDAEYEELKNDIKAHGLLVAIWIYEGKIIDGRNRYRACLELGIQPRFQEWDGRGSLISFVISLNDRRRHLSTSQRAMVAAKAKPMFEEEARQRQLVGKPADLPPKLEEGRQGEAAAQAAALMKVSISATYQGQKVLRDGSPELQRAVESDQISVSTAAGLASLDKDEQVQVLKQDKAKIRAKAKEVAQQKKTTTGKPANNGLVKTSGSKVTDDAVKKQEADEAEGFRRYRELLPELEATLERDKGGFAALLLKLKPKDRDLLMKQQDNVTNRMNKLRKALDAA